MFRNFIIKFKFSTFDPFQELGVNHQSTMQEIKDAYIRLSKQYHPDVNQSHDAHEKFKRIAEAYNFLKKQKFEEKVRGEFKAYYYSGQSEEQLFKDIFGFYFHENPQEYYKPENANKRMQYQDLLKKYKTQYQEGGQMNKQDFSDFKINRKFEGHQYSTQDNQKLYTIIGLSGLLLSGIFIYISFLRKAPELQKEVIKNEQIKQLRNLTQQRHQQNIDNIKNMYSDINHQMIKFDSQCSFNEMLLKYTIYSDLEFYFVKPEIFYQDEKSFLRSSNFEKFPLKKSKLNYQLTHSLEAERCLQNIFVSVNDVLSQIEQTGNYIPPGIFMQFYGYLYFKIRNKPLIIENLIKAKEYISLFDLFWEYQSPIPYYYDQLNEFQVFSETGNQLTTWEGNAYLSTKSIDKFYLKGQVQNVFISRPQQYTQTENLYLQAWGNHFQNFQ